MSLSWATVFWKPLSTTAGETLYESIESLVKKIVGLSGAVNLPRATALEDRSITEKWVRCKSLIDGGLLEETDTRPSPRHNYPHRPPGSSNLYTILPASKLSTCFNYISKPLWICFHHLIDIFGETCSQPSIISVLVSSSFQ